jgi:DNA polymerase/3'-5' exonuclease PolX
MSTGTKLPWQQAAEIAEQLVRELTPHVERLKTVGSIRRRKPEVGDIELLAEPRMIEADFFGTPGPDLEPIRQMAARWGRVLKNGDRYIQVEILDGVHVDLFLCYAPAQWGSLLAIRTGPAELGQHAVTCMKAYGLRHVQGHIERDGTLVPTPTEEDFFAAARLPCLPPRQRGSATSTPEAFRTLPGGAR